MIRSDAQTCRALRVLLARVNLGDLWNNEGPTDRAVELLETRAATLSPTERTLFLAAWAIWSRVGALPLAELRLLDADHVEAVCSLLVALTRDGATVEAWIENPVARRIRAVGGHCSRPGCVGAPERLAREHSDRPACACACEDCAQARGMEDRIARKASRQTTRIRR
jgi:hypothetical protein